MAILISHGSPLQGVTCHVELATRSMRTLVHSCSSQRDVDVGGDVVAAHTRHQCV